MTSMEEPRRPGAWQIPGYLETRAGRLTVNGVDALKLVEEHGSPLYVFSEKRIVDNVRGLRRSLESVHPRLKLCYASKANSNMSVLDAVRRAGGDIEVNSGGELFKARTIGFRPDQIVFNGVSKTDEEIRDAVEYGVLAINIDSPYELDQTTRVARSIGKRANVAIRIVPEIITRSHIGLQTGLLSSKFGLSPSQIEAAFARALEAKDAIDLAGVHIHVGSQTPDAHPFALAFAEMWKFLVDLRKKTHAPTFHPCRSRARAHCPGGHQFNHLGSGLRPTVLGDGIHLRDQSVRRGQVRHRPDGQDRPGPAAHLELEDHPGDGEAGL